MAETEIRGLIIGVLLIAGALIGMQMFAQDFMYLNNDIVLENITGWASYNRTNLLIENITSKVEDVQLTGVSIIDIPLMVLTGVYNAVILMFEVPGIFVTMMSNFMAAMPLELQILVVIITAIISIIVLFEIISAFMKYRL